MYGFVTRTYLRLLGQLGSGVEEEHVLVWGRDVASARHAQLPHPVITYNNDQTHEGKS